MAKKKVARKTAKSAAPRKKSPKKKTAKGGGGFGDVAGLWNTAKKKESRRNQYETPEIDDGDYVARIVKARLAQKRRGNKDWYVALDYVVLFEAFAGTKVSSVDTLSDEPVGDTGLLQIDLFKNRLESMDIEVDKIDASQFPQLIEHLNNEQPVVYISCQNKSWTTQKGDEARRVNVYVNGLCEDLDAEIEMYGEPWDDSEE